MKRALLCAMWMVIGCTGLEDPESERVASELSINTVASVAQDKASDAKPPWLAHLERVAAEHGATVNSVGPCGGSAYACADGNLRVLADNGVICESQGSPATLGPCTNRNVALQNTGFQCAGCDWARFYWGSRHSGAFVCVPPGFTVGIGSDPNLTFSNGGSPQTGRGDTVWFNVASAAWSGPCNQ